MFESYVADSGNIWFIWNPYFLGGGCTLGEGRLTSHQIYWVIKKKTKMCWKQLNFTSFSTKCWMSFTPPKTNMDTQNDGLEKGDLGLNMAILGFLCSISGCKLFWEDFHLPSGKLTWQWKMDLLKMYSLLKMVIFHCVILNHTTFFQPCFQLLWHLQASNSSILGFRSNKFWRIIPGSKLLIRGQPYLGDLLTMVINHLLTGMILQVSSSK